METGADAQVWALWDPKKLFKEVIIMKLKGKGAFLKALQKEDWDYTQDNGSIVVFGPRGLRFCIMNYANGSGIQNAYINIRQTEGVRTFSARILNLRTWDEILVMILRLQEWYQAHRPDVGAAWKRYIAVFPLDAEMEFDGVPVDVYLYSESNFYSTLISPKKCKQSSQK